MDSCEKCNVCSNPATFKNALESKQVYSNVREFKAEKFTVWRCSSCNSIHSREAVDLERYYENYFIKKSTLNYFVKSSYYGRLNFLIKSGLRKHHIILDYGCSEGLFVSFLNQLGYGNAYGYDPYVAKYSSAETLNKEYNFITAYDVLEHVDNPYQTLSKLTNLLKTNSILVIGTPNADEVSLFSPDLELHQPFHRHIVSERALENMAHSTGLSITRFNKRWYLDTIYPFVNARFVLTYVRRSGNLLDVLVEPPNWKVLLFNPQLIFYGFVGYFWRWKGNMTVALQKI